MLSGSRNCKTNTCIFCFIVFTLSLLKPVKFQSHIEIKCFKTVTYYHDNPSVTGKSYLSYNHMNDEFQTLPVNLSCHNPKETLVIDAVKLSLPALEEEFCLDSKKTDYTTCYSDSQCECCEVPKKRCHVDTNDMTELAKACNGHANCTVNITSNFLDICRNREYSCESKKCHSRWAEISYSCEKKELNPTVQTNVPTDETAFTFPWWGILLIISILLLLLITITFHIWKHHKQKTKNSKDNYGDDTAKSNKEATDNEQIEMEPLSVTDNS